MHRVLTNKCQILISFVPFWDGADQQILPRAAPEKSVFQIRSVSKYLDVDRAEKNKTKDYTKTRREQKKTEEREILVWPAVADTNRRAKTEKRQRKNE